MMQRLNMENDEHINDDEIINDSLGTKVLSSKLIYEKFYSLYDSISSENIDDNEDESDNEEDINNITTLQKQNQEEVPPITQRRKNEIRHKETRQRKKHLRTDLETNTYNKEKLKTSDLTNNKMTIIIDKNDERLCNFLWCALKFFSTKERAFNLTQPQHSIAKAAINLLIDTPQNHKERHKQILSTINKLMKPSPEKIFLSEMDIWRFLKNLVTDHFTSRNKYSITKFNNDNDWRWAFDYINKNDISEFSFIKPTSNDEIKAAIISTIDLAFVENQRKSIKFINRFNKAAQQRKYRENNNNSIEIPNKTYEKLLILSKAINKNKNETIRFLIEQELKNIKIETIRFLIERELENNEK